jgi:multicomponent Na+:H+ antiporter subunit B
VRRVAVIGALLIIGAMLFYAIGKMPPMNSRNTPDKTHVVPRYLEKGEEEGGARNIVTGVILNYRGYDTMGEVTVIFSALCAVVALLDREKRGLSRSGPDASGVRSSVIVRTVVRFAFPVILFFAVAYMMLHGEASPGGGFQGGAILGASVIVFTLAFGLPESTRRMPLKVRTPLESTAMIGFLSMGFIGIAYGVNFLTYLLPGVHGTIAQTIRNLMITVIELGIGIGGGIIFISIVFAMMREDKFELRPDIPQP